MIPYRPNRLTAVPKTLQVRLEIMKAIRTLFAQDHLEKFDPDQPRVPAGNSDGGQWTNEGGKFRPKDTSGNITTAARSRMSEAECEAQFEEDLAICRRVRLDACYGQAMARYAACTSGHQIPPLNF